MTDTKHVTTATPGVWNVSLTHYLLAARLKSWSHDGSPAWQRAAKVLAVLAGLTSAADTVVNFSLATGRVVRDGSFLIYEAYKNRLKPKTETKPALNPWVPGRYLCTYHYYGYTLRCLKATLLVPQGLWNAKAYASRLPAAPEAYQHEQQLWTLDHPTVKLEELKAYIENLPANLKLSREASVVLLARYAQVCRYLQTEQQKNEKILGHLFSTDVFKDVVAAMWAQKIPESERLDEIQSFTAWMRANGWSTDQSMLALPQAVIDARPDIRTAEIEGPDLILTKLQAPSATVQTWTRAFDVMTQAVLANQGFEIGNLLWAERFKLFSLSPATDVKVAEQLLRAYFRFALAMQKFGGDRNQLKALHALVVRLSPEAVCQEQAALLSKLFAEEWNQLKAICQEEQPADGRVAQVNARIENYAHLAHCFGLPLTLRGVDGSFKCRYLRWYLCTADFSQPAIVALFTQIYWELLGLSEKEGDFEQHYLFWRPLRQRTEKEKAANNPHWIGTATALARLCKTPSQLEELRSLLGLPKECGGKLLQEYSNDAVRACTPPDGRLKIILDPWKSAWEKLLAETGDTAQNQVRRLFAQAKVAVEIEQMIDPKTGNFKRHGSFSFFSNGEASFLWTIGLDGLGLNSLIEASWAELFKNEPTLQQALVGKLNSLFFGKSERLRDYQQNWQAFKPASLGQGFIGHLSAAHTLQEFTDRLKCLPKLAEGMESVSGPDTKEMVQSTLNQWQHLYPIACGMLYRCATPHEVQGLLHKLSDWSTQSNRVQLQAMAPLAVSFCQELLELLAHVPALQYKKDQQYKIIDAHTGTFRKDVWSEIAAFIAENVIWVGYRHDQETPSYYALHAKQELERLCARLIALYRQTHGGQSMQLPEKIRDLQESLQKASEERLD